ncbi:MAG: Na+/H+ antiporter subunit E [Synergistetes bacterium]|nr:MAG: cation antiporter [bacterium 42_11]MBC7331765.1 Na+/H+ antiporter subunit E [Synergistota bacterium]MDK2870710.1 multicomponent Na+:H+ antiporter subunit [bacterium]
MGSYVVVTILSYLFYLILTMSSGDLGLWSSSELVVGIPVALVAGLAGGRVFGEYVPASLLNPIKWVLFLYYVFVPFFIAMAKANIDVAMRVLTGKINPGIVRIKTGLKKSMSLTFLANSITLTPGTLSVDVDEESNDLYVHWIDVKNIEPEPAEVCGDFPQWARRIAE